MGISMRHVVWTSATLALGAFIYVVTLEPMDENVHPRAAALNRVPNVNSQVTQIRRAMAANLDAKALEIAREISSKGSAGTEAIFYRALTEQVYGSPEDSLAYWEEILIRLEKAGTDRLSHRQAYFNAWAHIGVGDVTQGQALFSSLADSSAERSGHFDLACYRSMAGELDIAMEHWELAIEAGYRDSGWWRVDPDLFPLHEDERFWAISEQMIQPEDESSVPDASEGGIPSESPSATETED